MHSSTVYFKLFCFLLQIVIVLTDGKSNDKNLTLKHVVKNLKADINGKPVTCLTNILCRLS